MVRTEVQSTEYEVGSKAILCRLRLGCIVHHYCSDHERLTSDEGPSLDKIIDITNG